MPADYIIMNDENYELDHHVTHIKQNHPMSAKRQKSLNVNMVICIEMARQVVKRKNGTYLH